MKTLETQNNLDSYVFIMDMECRFDQVFQKFAGSATLGPLVARNHFNSEHVEH